MACETSCSRWAQGRSCYFSSVRVSVKRPVKSTYGAASTWPSAPLQALRAQRLHFAVTAIRVFLHFGPLFLMAFSPLCPRELLETTCRLANTLKRHGVRRGDRVALYMPVSPLAVAAMLACARIGAVHTVVFAGFSAESLAGRINDGEREGQRPRVLVLRLGHQGLRVRR